MRKLWVITYLCFVGCGYSTRAVIYPEQKIYIDPIVNAIDISREDRTYSSYSTFPILLEKRLTNILINKFNVDGHLQVSSVEAGALRLAAKLVDYKKEALRYNNQGDVSEQRLLLYLNMVLYNSKNEIITEQQVVGETSFYLEGSLAKSESSAQIDLIDDTARRIIEVVLEDW